MVVLGLTGPSGAGKGALAAALGKHGIPHLDTDAIYHELLIPPSPCLDALVAAFGTSVLSADGTLDRTALAAKVFAENAPKTYLTTLNTVSHSFILAETRQRIADARAVGKRAVLVDAPLLYESGFDAECDAVIAVIAPRSLRLARIMARDKITEEAASARLDAQKEDAFYTDRADFVVFNDGDLRTLEAEAEKIMREIGGRRG